MSTDSELVLWRKGKKNPGEGSEIEPETIYLQGVRAGLSRDGVPFVEWANELSQAARLTAFNAGSRRETES
jgi:hypothetical protein